MPLLSFFAPKGVSVRAGSSRAHFPHFERGNTAAPCLLLETLIIPFQGSEAVCLHLVFVLPGLTLRFNDNDIFGHVNNAVYYALVDDAVRPRTLSHLDIQVELLTLRLFPSPVLFFPQVNAHLAANGVDLHRDLRVVVASSMRQAPPLALTTLSTGSLAPGAC